MSYDGGVKFEKDTGDLVTTGLELKDISKPAAAFPSRSAVTCAACHTPSSNSKSLEADLPPTHDSMLAQSGSLTYRL